MIFCKYSFPSIGVWESHKALLSEGECAIVELGDLAGDGYFSVDVMWQEETNPKFNEYEVFPDPVGVHTFLGCEDMYKERFCQFNPESPYCEII